MKKILLLTGIIGLSTILSCDDSDLDKVNPNGVTFDTYFTNDGELTAGINSAYALLQGFGLGAREWFFVHDLRGDEMATGGGQLEAPRNQLLIGANDAGNSVSNDCYTGWFRVVHRSNVVIESAAKTTASFTAATKNRIVGEAKFLRALAYYELGTVWGGVPLYTEYVKSVDGAKPRATQLEVYKQVLDDLKAAEGVLPDSYPASEAGRATKAAAQMLMARTYLQQGDYASAKTELEKIVSSGRYKIVDNYLDLTNEEGEFNAESIFEMVFSPSNGAFNWSGPDGDGNSAQEECIRTQEYSPIGWRNLIPSNKILDNYERTSKGDTKNDPRFDMSFWKTGDTFNNGKDVLKDDAVQGNLSKLDGKDLKISWRKYSILYKSNAGFASSGINMRVMRYADVLLLLAECENELGNSARAITLMNQVRARKSVDMPPYPTKNYPCDSKAKVFEALQHERYVELAAEQVRNFDLLRWRKNKKQTTESISYFTANKHELLPLPQAEIDNNPKIDQKDQNPGY
ncbi:RagB/SusD family nutrient uptake outer membrane protein [Emticicia sp. SJ17W-69]|uniref:RagB/SusD family nutrient uptake outer membrane protein n=1 Tax=Emticicia sp. SJ17W-69 TaxID=3421657 RepID=UPI003EBF0E24